MPDRISHRPRGGLVSLSAATTHIGLTCALLLAGGWGLQPAGAADWAGEQVVENGVPHVRNPASPLLEPLRLEPQELWRLGGDTEDEDEFFGLISDIEVSDAGDVYLLDRQLVQVMVYSPDGEYERTIGREGEGPGEFRRPSALFLDPRGRLAVVQAAPSRMVCFEPDGSPSEPLPLPSPEKDGFRAVRDAQFRGGVFVIDGRKFSMKDGVMERTVALVRVDESGRVATTYHSETERNTMAEVVVREDGGGFPWRLGPDGNVYASLDRSWKVTVWNPQGEVVRVIEMPEEPILRSAAEKDKAHKDLASRVRIRGRRGRIQPKIEVSDRERAIRWLEVTDDGSLWVLGTRALREAPPGVLPFDVFDREGHYQQRVELAMDADFEEDRIVFARDRVFVITEFEAAARAMMARFAAGDAEEEEADLDEEPEPMAVVCYPLDLEPLRAVEAQGSGTGGGR